MGACGCRINPIDEKQRQLINSIITYWFGSKEEWDQNTKPPEEITSKWFSSEND